MKHTACFFTILVFALLLSVVSCGQFKAEPTATPAPTMTPPLPPTPTSVQDLYLRRLDVNGQDRIYYDRVYFLHIPPGLDISKPVPVVFAFHVLGEFAQDMAKRGLSDVADKNGFLVVYPQGTDSSWNAGSCCGPAAMNRVDDVAFVRQILTDLGTIANIDPKRIYATGFSNGAMFSYRLGCEMSETFAAIAPVAGSLVYGPCLPQKSVSVINEIGLLDPNYAGTAMAELGLLTPSTEQVISFWTQVDGCTGSPQVEIQGQITHTVYAPCSDGSAVELYTIEGLSHEWPYEYGGFDVDNTIWKFFAAHPKP